MNSTVANSSAGPNPAAQADRWRVGTLKYTLGGLIWVFAWVLWGDFCFSLMETVIPTILPLHLKAMGASDKVLPWIMVTIPSVIVFFLNPTISTASDRYRSRWGRRVPFLLFATPFVSAALIMMAFHPQLGNWLFARFGTHSAEAGGAVSGWTAAGMAIFAIGFSMATFKVFDMFINTVYWYLFNDVVPQAFMNRFMGLFRTVGSACGALYNWYVVPTYDPQKMDLASLQVTFRYIFIGAAIIYFLGFMSMCLMIKEGEYPPPDKLSNADSLFGRVFGTMGTYFRECTSHPVFLFFFLHSMFFNLAGAVGVYDKILLNSSLQISMKQMGHFDAIIAVIVFCLNYPIGALADRFHPLRVMLWMELGLVLIAPLSLVWLRGTYTPESAYHTWTILRIIEMPMGLLFWAVQIPLMMRIFPRDRFGQFCSFNAMCGTAVGFVSSLVVGYFMGYLQKLYPAATYGADYYYRAMPFWRIPLMCVAFVFLFLLFREWKKLGGEKSYSPPGFSQEAFDSHRGFEVIPAASEGDAKVKAEV